VGNEPTLHRLDVSYKKTTLRGRFLSVWVQHTYLKLLCQVEPYFTVPTARASGNTRNRTETSCSSDIRADQPTPCSHTMQSMYYRFLSDACKIGWSFTSILQVGMTGFEPATTGSQNQGSTKLSYIPLNAS
jgi:hypothetical protein